MKQIKKYPCPLTKDIHGECRYGGSKNYNYGYFSGTGTYCRLLKKWVGTLIENDYDCNFTDTEVAK